MKRSGYWIVRLILLSAAILALVMVSASRRPGAQAQGHVPVHLTTDWSHRHVVFSAPGTFEQAMRLQNEPRYWHQWFRRYARTIQAANPNATGLERVFREDGDQDDRDHRGHPRHHGATDSLQRDWGMSLGAGATGGDEMYPAKFTFDVNAAPSCANDFVVFNTGVAAGVATAAGRTGSFTNQPVVGNTVTIGGTEVLTATVAVAFASGTATLTSVPNAGDTITVGSTTYTFDGVATGTVTMTSNPALLDTVTIGGTTYTFVSALLLANQVLIGGTANNTAANLEAAINATAGQCASGPPCFGGGTAANASVTAAVAGNVVTITAITPGAGGNSIAFSTVSGGRMTLSPNTGTLSGGSGNFANPNEVVLVPGSTNNSARNLQAAINAMNGQCFNPPATCYGTGTTANASVTAARAGNVVTVTAIVGGAGGNSIVFTTASGGRITLVPNTGTLSGGVTGGSNTGLNFQIGANTTGTATNLAAAIARNGAGVGVTATSGGNVVAVTATTAGPAGNSITLATTISSTNFTWGGPTLAGGANAPGSILGFNNLYSTQNGATPAGLCGSSGPNLLFTFNTDIGTNGSGTTTGATTSSPVLSGDGSKIAYVESGDAGGAILRLLKWDNNSGGASPIAPDTIIPAGSPWSGCNLVDPTISCLIGLRFGNAAQDSESAPFYVYSADTLYVGDDTGKLHKFINVFGITGSTPSEVTTGGWPVTVNASGTVHLHSPIYDSVSGNIFVGDLAGNGYYVKEAGSSVGVCSSTSNGGVAPCLGTTNGAAGGPTSIALGGAIDDAPIVDSTTQRVFFFDGTVSAATCAAAGTNAALVQLDTQLTSSTQVKVCFANNGTTGQVTNMKSGAFDNAYVSSAMGSKTGKLYICARQSANRDHPALFRIGFNSSGVMNAAVDPSSGGPNNYLDLVSTSGEECSPITEVYNPNTSTDWLFLSVGNSAALGTTCSATGGGCLMSFNLTALGATWPPANATGSYNLPLSGANPGDGGSSGIIVDNVSTAAQASNIYFTFLTTASISATCNGDITTGCAVKLTQANLN